MLQKKLFFLVALSFFIMSCDSRRSEPSGSSYTSQSEILDMQEEEYGLEYSEDHAADPEIIEREEERQDVKKSEPVKEDEKIDNTSSESDDTIY